MDEWDGWVAEKGEGMGLRRLCAVPLHGTRMCCMYMFRVPERSIYIYIYSYFSDWLAYSEHNSQHGGFMYLPYLPTFLQYQCRRHINCKMAVVLVH